VDKRHKENQQTNNCGQTPHRKPIDIQLWTNVTQKTNRQTTVEKRHTENQQTNNSGQTTHRKPIDHSCLSVGFLCDVCPQLFVCWFSVWRLSTAVCLLVFCVAFVHSCLSIGFLCDVCPQLFVFWFSVTQKTNRQTTVDKRHKENQQTNNCGQTPHRKPRDKQLWTNDTQKTNRQTTVDKRHTENKQTNNCGQTPHRNPTLFVCWFSVWRISTVVCLLIFCMTFVHSCLSIGFLCDVCPQLFVSWFSVWPFSTVVCLLVFCVAFVHSCLSLGFLCGVCPQLFVCWFSVWRLSTVVCLLKENQQTNNCRQTPHRKPRDKQLWTNATQKTNRQTTVEKGHTVNQETNNCGQTSHRKPLDKQLWTKVIQ
jgi:hypothetical protein